MRKMSFIGLLFVPRPARVIVLFGFCIIAITGCVHIKEGARKFLAISTRDIENARDKAIVKIVDYNYENCYKKVEGLLPEIGSTVYARSRDLIAVYIGPSDTTPAGIFFTDIGGEKTKLEIASPASDAKEYLADKIFTALEE